MLVDGKVIQTGDDQPARGEVAGRFPGQPAKGGQRHLGKGFFRRLAAHCGHESGLFLRDQVCADKRHQILTQKRGDALEQIVHGHVEVHKVAASAEADLAHHTALGQHIGGFVFAHVLQPAFVHVLQHGVGHKVGCGGNAGTVPADELHIGGNAPLHIALVTLWRVLEFGPGVHRVVPHVHIGLGGGQFVGIFVEPQHVARAALPIARGVGAAGDRAGRTSQDIFALQLVHGDDVDAGQKRGGFNDLVLEQLLHAGRD